MLSYLPLLSGWALKRYSASGTAALGTDTELKSFSMKAYIASFSLSLSNSLDAKYSNLKLIADNAYTLEAVPKDLKDLYLTTQNNFYPFASVYDDTNKNYVVIYSPLFFLPVSSSLSIRFSTPIAPIEETSALSINYDLKLNYVEIIDAAAFENSVRRLHTPIVITPPVVPTPGIPLWIQKPKT
jgi:hypothetical protein